jgi:membrane protein YqaA with SNARE-associated domain
MTILYIIIGGAAGGTLGWLLGRFNGRRRQEDCKTPT